MDFTGPGDIAATFERLGLGDIGTFTVTTLPDPTASARKTAWVTDLYGQGGRVVSESGFWKPIRPLAVGSAVVQDITLRPLITPTTLLFTGNIATATSNAVNFSTNLAYPGMRQRITRRAAGAGQLIVNGVGLPLNNWQDWEFDGQNFVQTASGGLL